MNRIDFSNHPPLEYMTDPLWHNKSSFPYQETGYGVDLPPIIRETFYFEGHEYPTLLVKGKEQGMLYRLVGKESARTYFEDGWPSEGVFCPFHSFVPDALIYSEDIDIMEKLEDMGYYPCTFKIDEKDLREYKERFDGMEFIDLEQYQTLSHTRERLIIGDERRQVIMMRSDGSIRTYGKLINVTDKDAFRDRRDFSNLLRTVTCARIYAMEIPVPLKYQQRKWNRLNKGKTRKQDTRKKKRSIWDYILLFIGIDKTKERY